MDNTNVNINNAQEKFDNELTPMIHRWGRTTMVIALSLSFLPIVYMYFVKGWQADVASYISVFIAIGSFGIGMWLTEPMSYFPVLGSAGTYMGYFAGNVGNMRAPVAISVQSALDTDVTTAKGNIATIVGIAMSVYFNLAILLFIVLMGQQLLAVFPPTIVSAFQYILPAMYGSLIVMRFRKNTKQAIKFGIPAAILYFIIKSVPAFSTFALALVMGGSILSGFGIYKFEEKKAE